MLAQLLAHGTQGAPVQENSGSQALFQGGREDWIQSITTISTPNQGTTLGSALTVLGDVVVQLVAGLAGLIGLPQQDAGVFFDAKLDQFGISHRTTGESLLSYVKRVMGSSIFDGSTKDNCLYSLSADGVNEENRWVRTLPTIYYYSYSVQGSFEARNLQFKKIALPQTSILKLLQPFSLILGGRYTVDKLGKTEAWLANDGAVNTASMVSDGQSEVVEFASVSRPGRWHHMVLLTNVDHLGGIGNNPLQKVFDVYVAHMALFASLPVQPVVVHSNKGSLRGINALTVMGEHTATDEVMQRIEAAVKKVNSMAPSDAEA